MNYDVEYFINKFQSIPEDKWTTRNYTEDDKHCALGHCGVGSIRGENPEAEALIEFFDLLSPGTIVYINDGLYTKYQQPTPKQRILAALYDIKNNINMANTKTAAIMTRNAEQFLEWVHKEEYFCSGVTTDGTHFWYKTGTNQTAAYTTRTLYEMFLVDRDLSIIENKIPGLDGVKWATIPIQAEPNILMEKFHGYFRLIMRKLSDPTISDSDRAHYERAQKECEEYTNHQ
jgi:hypothetical protein